MDTEKLSADLRGLALDLRWSWNHATDDLWGQLDPELWDLSRNPWVILQTVSQEKLEQLGNDPAFMGRLETMAREREGLLERQRWFQQSWPDSKLRAIAYFSMEYMLSDALPIYSGGLGNVAGDQLKAANDLGVPVMAVGLLYQRGYFRQYIDADGQQHALYPYNDPGQLPIAPLRESNGEWLRVPINLPGVRIWVRTWLALVGRAKLFLLDTNDPANLPEYRGITGELYGGGQIQRLAQERILGIAGWRLLRKLGIAPEVCHLNEGHAAFAVLERARCFMEDKGVPFAQALTVTRAGNLFTTHTPVAAGFDQFSPDMMAQQFTEYAEKELGIPFSELLGLGRVNPRDPAEPFNMAWLAVRGSGAVNGVSRLHGEVSRQLFQPLFPRWPRPEVPVSHVTNGVHMPTWDSGEADNLWTRACGKGRWRGTLDNIKENIRKLEATELWTMRAQARKALIDYVRQRLARQLAAHGAPEDEVERARHIFDPATLTIGFARRFATYKRPNLLLRDPERLQRILMNTQYPVQLIVAGKAHPQDTVGQDMIRQWIQFIRHTPARRQAVFLSDYDMRMAQQLVGGIDLWLNTPRRPWEASGTSGMKVLVNGGLNFSELDGWWAEAFDSQVGWALGDGREHGEDPGWDAAEADRLYTLLETEIIPEFYQRDETGVPRAWVGRVCRSLGTLTPEYSANRTVRQYMEEHYLPAARAYLARAADHGRAGAEILNWRQEVGAHWRNIRTAAMNVQSDANRHVFTVQVYLDELSADSVRAEVFADAGEGLPLVREIMTRGQALAGSANTFAYTAAVAADRPADAFTPRVIPYHPAASVPLECEEILWAR